MFHVKHPGTLFFKVFFKKPGHSSHNHIGNESRDILVGGTGFEPVTPSMSRKYSNQLS